MTAEELSHGGRGGGKSGKFPLLKQQRRSTSTNSGLRSLGRSLFGGGGGGGSKKSSKAIGGSVTTRSLLIIINNE
jgi:hypothetical protein